MIEWIKLTFASTSTLIARMRSAFFSLYSDEKRCTCMGTRRSKMSVMIGAEEEDEEVERADLSRG
jgi:hypothetical protein